MSDKKITDNIPPKSAIAYVNSVKQKPVALMPMSIYVFKPASNVYDGEYLTIDRKGTLESGYCSDASVPTFYNLKTGETRSWNIDTQKWVISKKGEKAIKQDILEKIDLLLKVLNEGPDKVSGFIKDPVANYQSVKSDFNKMEIINNLFNIKSIILENKTPFRIIK